MKLDKFTWVVIGVVLLLLVGAVVTVNATGGSGAETQAYLPLAAQVQKLTSPAEMGELFKVIAFGKNITQPLLGFRSGDKRHTL